MQEIAHDITAASIIKKLRIKSLLSEVPKTEIARETGVHRMTVANRLKSDDMPLSAFLSTAHAIGADPVEVIQEAIDEQEKGERS